MIALLFALLAVALALAGYAARLYERLQGAEDEKELAVTSARQRGRNLETAIWALYGPDALPKLRAEIESAPWGSKNRSTVYVNGRLVGQAWEDGWRVASKDERARHDALQDRDHLLIADLTPRGDDQ